MIISAKLLLFAIVLFVISAHAKSEDGSTHETRRRNITEAVANKNETAGIPLSQAQKIRGQKYSSKISGSRYASKEHVFGIRSFPVGEKTEIDQSRSKQSATTENVLDFRIRKGNRTRKADQREVKPKGNRIDVEEDDDEVKLDGDDLRKAAAGGGKQKKEADEDEEKTLAQQVADGKYGLIQNELFANGSKRPGILSYRWNNEVPKDTKENLGGLAKDEIWLAEDHVLVLRGGNYDGSNENQIKSTTWPAIDNFKAPNRQVKIPKNPEIPPPFPVQLTPDGPIEFIKGQNNPSFYPPILPPIPPFAQQSNKTFPIPFAIPPLPPPPPPPPPPHPLPHQNHSFPFPIPPPFLPPFLSNLPPGATFVAPPGNGTEIDEDDPSIYYPPKYDFVYSADNTTVVPPGPLVPGIILPPPPDFFSLLENDTAASNETDDSYNSVTPFTGPKYLPALRKPTGRTRPQGQRFNKRPPTSNANSVDDNYRAEPVKPDKLPVMYVYPENSKHKPTTTSTSTTTTTAATPNSAGKYPSGFANPILVPGDPNRSVYHPLPTTSPKPNHITLPPTTKSLPKQIYIITTPEPVDKNRIESIYKNPKPIDANKYEHVSLEIHPLRSLIKPNVTVSYNGKYGHLPPPKPFQPSKPAPDIKIIRGQYVTQPPLTKASKVPSTDVNSITVTSVPVIKNVRLHPADIDKPTRGNAPLNPSKATLYFYDETATTTTTAENSEPEKTTEIAKPPASPQAKPVTPYYYTTHSVGTTPIRQFLEETFHSSNVLTRKPQIAHVNNAEIITHNGYSSDLPKMKHLNYGTPLAQPRPALKYHYVADGNAVVIPTPKIKELEIKNSGSSGLQTVNLDPPPLPPSVEQAPQIPPVSITPKPFEYTVSDGPFVPSNYYATVRPEHIHFTSQEQTLVDDITKNYFTIFGQKINAPSTTPLAPVSTPAKPIQESGLAYISDDGHNFKIQQVHESPGRKPSQSSSAFYTRDKPTSPRPSNFEKYLKELTGEDQRDYIVSGVFPVKIKKGKGFLGGVPHLLTRGPVTLQSPGQTVQYQPNLSTTLRPVVDVEIKPQYVQHISSTTKPHAAYQPPPQNVPFGSSFQQYLQEVTGSTTKRPVKVKKPNGNFLPNPQPSVTYTSDVGAKPVSLAQDLLVNYKGPGPGLEAQAELINNVGHPYDNIKIVDSPDLSRNAPPQYGPFNGQGYFPSPQKPEFYSHLQPSHENSFVSYNLPGNGGHFYFLTPQIIEGPLHQETRRQDKDGKRVNRSHGRTEHGYSRTSEHSAGYSDQVQQQQQNSAGYSNHDYPRRRRKKP